MNVVIVDDDPNLTRSLEIVLTRQGHKVRTFQDAAEADFFLEQGARVDVLILDYMMPEFNGVEIMGRVRDALPDHCKVILISGHTDLVDRGSLRKLGIDDFLPKPLDLHALSWMVAPQKLSIATAQELRNPVWRR